MSESLLIDFKEGGVVCSYKGNPLRDPFLGPVCRELAAIEERRQEENAVFPKLRAKITVFIAAQPDEYRQQLTVVLLPEKV